MSVKRVTVTIEESALVVLSLNGTIIPYILNDIYDNTEVHKHNMLVDLGIIIDHYIVRYYYRSLYSCSQP